MATRERGVDARGRVTRSAHRLGALAAGACMLAAVGPGGGCATVPNADSGPDHYRHQAEEIELDKWVPDSVSSFDGDRIDWKSFVLPTPGDVLVTVVFADDFTAAEVGLFDKYGMPITSDVKAESDGPRLVLKGAAPAGRNFVRIKAGPKHRAEYTIEVKLASQRFVAPK